jgi:Na+-transporting NADH:ubiquinone oxidoreductase subunit C
VSSHDSIGKIIRVAFALCIVCSVVGSTAAVMLPAQEANKELDRKRNILAAAGMLEDGKSVEELFAAIRAALRGSAQRALHRRDPAGYDQRDAAKDPRCPRTSAMRTSPRSGAARTTPRSTWSAPATAKAGASTR